GLGSCPSRHLHSGINFKEHLSCLPLMTHDFLRRNLPAFHRFIIRKLNRSVPKASWSRHYEPIYRPIPASSVSVRGFTNSGAVDRSARASACSEIGRNLSRRRKFTANLSL